MNTLAEELTQIVGATHVDVSDPSRDLMASDIWAKAAKPAIVVAPQNTEELSRCVGAAAQRNTPIVPRGAGMSYTGGYTSGRDDAMLIDLRHMDEIVSVNATDMTVRVEAGCTWAQLYATLKPQGLRTPFWGPLSGISSTIGGGLSQNNAFFGAGVHGPSSESVLALTVVLANGDILHTDHSGARRRHAFPAYGPNLTGLFLSDCGALGVKSEAVLRLIPSPEHEDWLSLSFKTRETCAEALADMARANIACELFAFDPNLARVRLRRASMMADAAALAKVVTAQKSIFGGLREGAKVAIAGRNIIGDANYSLHAVIEGPSKAGVADGMSRLRAIGRSYDAKEIENTIPKVIRANPFTPLNNVLGPDGERWAPIHGIVPMSQGPRVWAELDAVFAKLAPEFEASNVSTGYLATTLGATGYLIEPVFFWPDERFAIHDVTVEPQFLKKLPVHPANPDATSLVKSARAKILDVFTEAGAAHFQIGRAYPFAKTREPAQWALLRAIKSAVDPHDLMNPGVLGL